MAKFRGISTGSAASSFANANALRVRGAEGAARGKARLGANIREGLTGIGRGIARKRETARVQGNIDRQFAANEQQRQVMALSGLHQRSLSEVGTLDSQIQENAEALRVATVRNNEFGGLDQQVASLEQRGAALARQRDGKIREASRIKQQIMGRFLKGAG